MRTVKPQNTDSGTPSDFFTKWSENPRARESDAYALCIRQVRSGCPGDGRHICVGSLAHTQGASTRTHKERGSARAGEESTVPVSQSNAVIPRREGTCSSPFI